MPNRSNRSLTRWSLLLVLATACGGSADEGTAPQASIVVSPAAATITVGQAQALTATVIGAANAVSWSTASASIATVTSAGVVTGVAPGTTSITAQALGDPSVTASAIITVVAATGPASGYSLTTSPASATLQQGGTTNVGVTVARTGGFTGTITLSASGLPAGVTASFSPATLTGTATASVVTLTATASATVGTASFTVRGAATGLSDQTTLGTVVVQAASTAPAAVTVGLNTANITIARGQYGVIVPIAQSTTYTGSADVLVTGLPTGVTAGFISSDASSGTPSTTGFVTVSSTPDAGRFRLSVSASALVGTYAVTVRVRPTNTAFGEGTTTLQLTIVDAQAASSPAWLSLSAGSGRVCGVRADDRTWCWGSSVPEGALAEWWVATVAAGDRHLAAVSVGASVACGFSAAGSAYCWGSNNSLGQLGTGAATTTVAKAPAPVAGGLAFTAISAGNSHVCGIAGGKAYCWGAEYNGALGDGVNSGTTFKTVPTAVLGGLTFSRIFAGDNRACALTSGGTAYCWGANSNGELGDGSTTDRTTPVAVQGGLSFSKLVVWGAITCGLALDGAAYCWGNGSSIPGASAGNVLAPRRIGGTQTYVDIDATTRHRCIIAIGGQAYCWGDNTYGQLGNGTTTSSSATMVAVSGGISFTKIDVGTDESCAVAATGALYCWGYNNNGALGDATRTNRSVPTLVKTF